jgi:NDP-sugar pyrophosphorylase family protein
MAVASTSYQVEVPYGVLEVDGDNKVSSLREKPRYTYYSNAGIYLVKKELLRMIPNDEVYNVTDLMEALIKQGGKLVSYPILGYWLDIGKHEDFRKAQEDIRYITI